MNTVHLICPTCQHEMDGPDDRRSSCPRCQEVLTPPALIRRAVITKSAVYCGGVEGRLEFACVFLMIVGIVSGAGLLLIGLLDSPVNFLICAAGVLLLLFGIAGGAVCKALAEMIRLFKMRNCLPHSGAMTTDIFSHHLFSCSACRAVVDDRARECPACHAVFEKE